MQSPEISIIISTYNSPEWLEKVLWGYQMQTFKNFELVVADDGSGPKTKELLETLQQEVSYPIRHVWHQDDGFRKCVILNKAIQQCRAEYILMSDGDCIPRADFVATHMANRKPGYFLSGGYFMLPMSISHAIDRKAITSGDCFRLDWLKAQGLQPSFKNNKLTAKGIKRRLLNAITPTNASWNGHNSSAWKADILAVNGFDERMAYGGEDREMGERMMNKGLKSVQIRYSAVVIHLDHARGYVNQEALAKNKAIRQQTKEQKSTWTPFGIFKQQQA